MCTSPSRLAIQRRRPSAAPHSSKSSTWPRSQRNRPASLADEQPTRSQLIGQAMSDKAVSSGKVSAAEVAEMVFHAIRHDQFYIYSHPKALGNAKSRFDAIVAGTNPPDPFAERPDIGDGLRQALRGA